MIVTGKYFKRFETFAVGSLLMAHCTAQCNLTYMQYSTQNIDKVKLLEIHTLK